MATPMGQTPSNWSIRIKNILTMLVCFFSIYAIQYAIWDFDISPLTSYDTIWYWLAILWAVPVLNSLFGLIGLATFTKPTGPVKPVSRLVSFRYVSRGFNDEVLRGSIRSVYEMMDKLPLFDYVIEVVTEVPIDLSNVNRDGRLVHLVMPADWETPNKTKFKARALQYLLLHSDIPDDAWIMHGDEESFVTESLINGIAQAVTEEEASGKLRIGQGIILYHRDRDDQKLLTCADSIRTGDDYARFSLQNRLGLTLIGFHGSFILVRNDVAKQIDFDIGPKGSITEDAWWALMHMDQGRRSRFVDGYMVEQAPHTALDFLKQRRRWFVGLWQVALYAPIRWRWRALIFWGNIIWSLSWLTLIYTFVNFFVGTAAHPLVHLFGNLSFTYYVSCYVIGMRANLIDNPPGFWRSCQWYALTIVGLPYFVLLETGAALYGIIKPDLGFHVIQKKAKSRPEDNDSDTLGLSTA